jgi:hypothetical protein
MSTKAGTIGISGRPVGSVVWTWIVSAIAAAALVMSAVALNVAARGDRSVTSVEGITSEAAGIASPLWDAAKLEAMEGRVLAATVQGIELWDADKLEAMEGRSLAATVQAQAAPPLWDAAKLEAMAGRVLAG